MIYYLAKDQYWKCCERVYFFYKENVNLLRIKYLFNSMNTMYQILYHMFQHTNYLWIFLKITNAFKKNCKYPRRSFQGWFQLLLRQKPRHISRTLPSLLCHRLTAHVNLQSQKNSRFVTNFVELWLHYILSIWNYLKFTWRTVYIYINIWWGLF